MTDVLPEAAVHKKVNAGILAAVSMAIIRLPMALGADLAEAENNISIVDCIDDNYLVQYYENGNVKVDKVSESELIGV